MEADTVVVVEDNVKDTYKCSTHGEHSGWFWCGSGIEGYDGYWCFLCMIDAAKHNPKGITHIVEKENE